MKQNVFTQFVRPLGAMMAKNGRARVRSIRATVIQIISPIIAIFIATLIYGLIEPTTIDNAYPDSNIYAYTEEGNSVYDGRRWGTANYYKLPTIENMYTRNVPYRGHPIAT